ncbi:MAG: RNA polymerase factor sigma-54 [Nitrospirae bacterium]|nr:RNA polymerase factor sigma-54 [Nitrospirota bacterium]
MDTKLDLRLTQKLIMTPQLQQAIKLLQLSKLELEQTVNQALLENPFLDEAQVETTETEEDEAYKTTSASELASKPEDDEGGALSPLDGENLKWGEYLSDDGFDNKETGYYKDNEEDGMTYDQMLTRPSSLSDHLSWQLNLATSDPDIIKAGDIIIGNLDDNGYLQSSLEEVTAASGVSVEKAGEALSLLQQFDPPGIAARDLRECLLIQLAQLGVKGTIVETIVSEHLSDFEKKRFPAIARRLGITLEDLAHALKVIERLEPKPGRLFYASDNLAIIPDVFVVKHEGEYVVLLNDDGIPRLKLNPTYRRMLRGGTEIADEAKGYLEEKFRSAIWMIRSIEQRNRTIYKVAQSIVKCQEDFLEKGINNLKPLTLREIAEDINMHESTVSRVTHNKYICTPQGIFELKYFFSSGLNTSDGNSCSSKSVRDMIHKLITDENHQKPFSDQQIMEYLKGQQIEIARRTVAKYRKELKIPSASRRRKLSI